MEGAETAVEQNLASPQLRKHLTRPDIRQPEKLGCNLARTPFGNVLRLIQPTVILNEGHKGYSNLAIATLYGFTPRYLLELSPTSKDRSRDSRPMYNNWLVDVCIAEFDKEGMIKLPLNVTVHGGEDWRDCLRESLERLNDLQSPA